MTAHDSEVPKEGQQVLTACAIIHENFDGVEKIFLARRAQTKKFLPNVFELPGGHIDFGETPEVGLAREIFEEFGMEIRVGDIFTAFTYHNHVKKSHSVELIYFAKFTNPLDSIKLNADDHSEYCWVSKDELPTTYTDDKSEQDPEFVAIRKAFNLLDGSAVDFGD